MDIHEVYQNGEIYKVVGRPRYNFTGEFAGRTITLYIEVEWSRKATWKKPLKVAGDLVEHITEKKRRGWKHEFSKRDTPCII